MYLIEVHTTPAASALSAGAINIAHDVENSLLDKVPKILEVLVYVEPEGELLAASLARLGKPPIALVPNDRRRNTMTADS